MALKWGVYTVYAFVLSKLEGELGAKVGQINFLTAVRKKLEKENTKVVMYNLDRCQMVVDSCDSCNSYLMVVESFDSCLTTDRWIQYWKLLCIYTGTTCNSGSFSKKESKITLIRVKIFFRIFCYERV